MTLSASQIKSFHAKRRDKTLEKSDRGSLSNQVSKKGRVNIYMILMIKLNGCALLATQLYLT